MSRILLSLNLAVLLVLPALMLHAPAGATTVAVLSWGRPAEIIAAADGFLIAAGGTAPVVLAKSESSDFVQRLYQAGALLVLDAGLFSGCLPSNKSGARS